MASVGEAAAASLNAGLRLGLDIQDRQRQQERQDKLDQQQASERAYQRSRVERQDRLTALEKQRELQTAEGTAMQEAGVADPVKMADYAARVQGLDSAYKRELGSVSGYDVEAETKAGVADLDDLIKKGPTNLAPGQFTRGLTVGTKRSLNDFRRIDGKPSRVEAAAAEFMEGYSAQDKQTMLRGLNVLMEPDLRKRIGGKSRFGGAIVGARIADLDVDPSGKRIIPLLRIYENNGKAEASGDEIRARRSMDPDAPQGATGHYDAPPTEGMDSSDGAKVRALTPEQGMAYIDQMMQLVELVNSPEGMQAIERDKQSGWDPDLYPQALASRGVKKAPAGLGTKYIPMGPNSSVLAVTTGADGTTSERVVRPDPVDKPSKEDETAEFIKRMVDEGVLTPKQGNERLQALAAKATQGSKQQGLVPVGGGSASGSGGGEDAKARDKRLGRLLQDAKEQRLGIEGKKSAALAEYKAAIQDAPRKKREEAKAEYDARVRALDSDDARLKKRMQDIEDQLDEPGEKKPGGGGLSDAKPPARVLKFDRQGNPVK